MIFVNISFDSFFVFYRVFLVPKIRLRNDSYEALLRVTNGVDVQRFANYCVRSTGARAAKQSLARGMATPKLLTRKPRKNP